MRTSPGRSGTNSSTRPERLLWIRTRRLAVRRQVRAPRGIVVGAVGRVVGARTLVRLAIRALPVGLHAREAGLEEQVAQLGQRPEPPVVREGALDLAAVAEAEVDVVQRAVRDRVEGGLVPHVEPLAEVARLAERAMRLGA